MDGAGGVRTRSGCAIEGREALGVAGSYTSCAILQNELTRRVQ
jgi:hypothetical protein